MASVDLFFISFCSIGSLTPSLVLEKKISTTGFMFIVLLFLLFWIWTFLLCVAEAVILGFQHYLLTLGMTVLIPTIVVPQMGGSNVSPFSFFGLFSCNVSSLLDSKIFLLLGREGKGDTEPVICFWTKHNSSIFVWNPTSNCSSWFIHLLDTHNLNYSERKIWFIFRSIWGQFESEKLTFLFCHWFSCLTNMGLFRGSLKQFEEYKVPWS